nr:MAG TPA: conotoxin [Caudoviricetes sp.]
MPHRRTGGGCFLWCKNLLLLSYFLTFCGFFCDFC